jgi:6-phosphogluconolactonase
MKPMIRQSAAVFLLAALVAPLHAVPVFIGTSTGGNSTSKGIYSADFDLETGKLTEPKLAAEYQNPGFLALHPSKPVLYSTGIPREAFEDKTGAVAAFAISDSQELTFLGEASSRGQNPCHVAVDISGSTVAVANYGDGMVATLRLDDAGVPGGAVSAVIAPGSGPHERQQGPHAHGVYFDKENSHLLVPDLGLDKVLVYPFDAETSKLGEAMTPLVTVPGAGPRHLCFTPDETHLYVINELDNTILAARHDGRGGFKGLGTVPTLPEGFTGNNSTSEIEVSPDGRFVYGSNRGHDSIVVFRRNAKTGKLTLVQHQPCGGAVPRHFAIAPGGKWLLCGHQQSGSISVFPIDPATGRLGEAVQTLSTPAPICILFSR